MTNRRIVVTRPGGPEVLRLIEEAMPEPAPDQVRVKILAAGVAYADIGVRLGTYPAVDSSSGTVSPGYDIVGVVEKLGEEVSAPSLGQRVAALTVTGGYAEYLCLKASELVPVPDGADPAEAVSLVLNYVTAYQMLHRVAEVKAGEWILAHGAAGGVGTALIQLGQLANVRVMGTASAKKQEIVTGLGATAINYQAEDFVSRVRQITGTGVHSVFDPIGGDNIARSFEALRPGGILVTYGNYIASQGGRANPEAAAQTAQVREGLKQRVEAHAEGSKRLAGYFIAALKTQHPEWFHTDLKILFGWLSERRIAPLVAERIPLAEAKRAHERLGQAAFSGKVVLVNP
jgi:NADPH2:quinone reductase